MLRSLIDKSVYHTLHHLKKGGSILCFHRVLPQSDPMRQYEINVDQFRNTLDWLGRDFTVVPLEEFLAQASAQRLRHNLIALTFDDGYVDNLTHALPLLQAYSMHATFFMTSGFAQGGAMWNDRIIEAVRQVAKPQVITVGDDSLTIDVDTRYQQLGQILARIKHLPYLERLEEVANIEAQLGAYRGEPLMMNGAQIKELFDAGMGIGGHTHTHPILCQLGDREAEAEISQNKHWLEEIIGSKVTIFAYPNGKAEGDFDQRHMQMVEDAGYDYALTTEWGGVDRIIDPYQVPRFTPWDNNRASFSARLSLNKLRRPALLRR